MSEALGIVSEAAMDGVHEGPSTLTVQMWTERVEEALAAIEEQYDRLRIAAGEYLSVPSGPGDWSAEEQTARRKLSEALDG